MMKVNKKLIVFIVKLIVVSLSFSFVFYKFFTSADIIDVFHGFRYFKNEQFILLGFVGMLVFINWLIEAIKWKILVSPLENISLYQSYRAVFAGVTVSMFTPNRTGDFFGRILVLRNENRIDGVAATIIGNFAQLIITILIGVLGTFYLIINGFLLPEVQVSWEILISVFFFLGVIAVLIYFNIKNVIRYLLKFSFIKKMEKYVQFVKQYEAVDFWRILILSLFRYLVFVIQFYYLFKVFTIELQFINCFASVALMYILMAVIPTFTIAELGVRGSVAIIVFEIFTTNVFGIVSTSILLWFLNLAIPALIGSIAFYKMKF